MEAFNQRKAHHIAEMIRRDISELRKSGVDIGKEANEVFDMIDDLAVELLKSTPPRNCDVGTAEEQAQRFGKMCGRYYHEEYPCDKRCPLASSGFITGFPRCQAYWAQMPYEEGGNK